MCENVKWENYLPPKQLPDTGEKTFRVGQIWAWRVYGDQRGRVDLIIEDNWYGDPKCATVVILAATNFNIDRLFARRPLVSTSPIGRAAILVADVGSEPTDPDILYQFLYK